MEAQIPPPIMSQTAERIKKLFATLLPVLRLTRPITKNITGGPKVAKKQAKIRISIPFMV
jgi:hypothetical protein